MTTTALHPNALPGKPWSFNAKTEAVPEKGAGPFTELSVMALPGMIHSFSAKTEAEIPEPTEIHSPLFLFNHGTMLNRN